MISFTDQFCEQDRPEPPAATAALPATIDLQALALTRFGDWRPKAAALVAKYKGVIFDVSTTKGLADATAARLEVRAPRYAAQSVSKASKSELARVSKAIGAEEQAVIDALAATEEHIDAQIRAGEAQRAAEKAQRDRIEAERVAKHRAGIERIRSYVAQAQGKTSAQIEAGLQILLAMRFDDSANFEEFADDAAQAMHATLEALRNMRDTAQAREAEAARIEAQRIEQARVAAEQAERQRKLDEQAVELSRKLKAIDDAAAALVAQQLAEQQRLAAELAAQNTPQQGANRDASAEQSHGAEGSESPTGRGTDGAPALGAAPVFHTPALDSQQVLKAEAATPDATDRENPAMRSPIGGSMGTGQPAAAGPVGEQPQINLGQIVQRLGLIVSAEFLASLGFEARAVKNSRQYPERDFPAICAALAAHCLAVGERAK